MRWQDWTLMTTSFMFSVALLPSLRGENKPTCRTSLMTAGFLFVNLLVFASLSLWLTLVATGFNCVAWSALAVQGHRKEKS